MIAVATKPTPIEVLERVVATLHFEAEHDDNPATWVECDGFACADAHEALGQVEAMVASMRRIKLKVEAGRSGSYTLDDTGKALAWIDSECNLALGPFQVQP